MSCMTYVYTHPPRSGSSLVIQIYFFFQSCYAHLLFCFPFLFFFFPLTEDVCSIDFIGLEDVLRADRQVGVYMGLRCVRTLLGKGA